MWHVSLFSGLATRSCLFSTRQPYTTSMSLSHSCGCADVAGSRCSTGTASAGRDAGYVVKGSFMASRFISAMGCVATRGWTDGLLLLVGSMAVAGSAEAIYPVGVDTVPIPVCDGLRNNTAVANNTAIQAAAPHRHQTTARTGCRFNASLYWYWTSGGVTIGSSL